jgi:hypothetical protein
LIRRFGTAARVIEALMGTAMRGHVASNGLRILMAMLVLMAEIPFGSMNRRAGAAFASEDVVEQIRKDQRERDAKREEARRHDAVMEMDRERMHQQDLALSVRKREVELEQERRRTASAELAALKSQRETLEKRIEYARKTVLASFDVSDRGFVSDPKNLPVSLQRARRLKDNMLKRLLLHPEDSKNYIANGTALNFLLELCGSSAFAGEFNHAALKAGQGPNPTEVEWLNQFTKATRINPQDLAQIRYQRGLAGPKLSGRFNEDPLDTNWPAVLRSELFRPRTRDIEQRRTEVLAELRANNGISAKSADGLLDAAHDLLTAIQDEQKALMRRVREKGDDTRAKSDWFRLHVAEEPIKVLLAGCYRLIEARKIEDVSLPPLNDAKGVTIERLMAYMHENKLYFSPSDANGQVAYGRILELMVFYYKDMSQYKIDAESGERRIEVMRKQEDEINEVVLGNKLNNFQQTEVTVARANADTARANADAEMARALVELLRGL